MKKHFLSRLLLALLISQNSNAADDLQGMFRDAQVSGQVRMFSISRALEFSNPASADFTRKANAIGGFLKYETAALNGLRFGTALYTTNGFAIRENKATNREVDPTILGKDNESYSILGEAYLHYAYKNTSLKVGRQKLNTPLAGADDGRMLPNLFQAYTLTNTDLSNTTLLASHVTHFAQGTFGRIYNAESGLIRDKILASTAAYSAINTRSQVGKFVNIGSYALGEKTRGLSIVSVTHQASKHLKLQLWDYYAHDILNAIYFQADYNFEHFINEAIQPFASLQYIREDAIGDKLLKNMQGNGDLSSDYFALKLGVNTENSHSYLAYSQVSQNSATDAVYANATMTMWGGMPAFIQGMLTRLAGTKASKISTTYDWKDFSGVSTSASYARFDMGRNNGWTDGDASEMDFAINYTPLRNLHIRLRATYANDFLVSKTGTLSWDEYHLVVKYNF